MYIHDLGFSAPHVFTERLLCVGVVTHRPGLLEQCSSYSTTYCFLGVTERVGDLKSGTSDFADLKSKIVILAETLRYEYK